MTVFTMNSNKFVIFSNHSVNDMLGCSFLKDMYMLLMLRRRYKSHTHIYTYYYTPCSNSNEEEQILIKHCARKIKFLIHVSCCVLCYHIYNITYPPSYIQPFWSILIHIPLYLSTPIFCSIRSVICIANQQYTGSFIRHTHFYFDQPYH